MDGASDFVTPRIGDPVPRKEDLRLLTGRGMFSDDVGLDGQVYAAVVRSPHAHAVIKAIETVGALEVPGVLAVLTGTDALADGLKPIPRNVMPGLPDITYTEGRFTVAGTDRSIGIFEVAAAAETRGDLPENLQGPLTAVSDETVKVAAFPFGCHLCEVDVDVDTGAIELVAYAAVDDVGRAVNPLILHGQAHGGIVQGLGQAMSELCNYDSQTGQWLSASLMDYAMPRADNVPSFTTEISEVPSPTNPLGIRAGGEGGTTPALAAYVNAIVDALEDLGVRHMEMPATAERVWRAI